MSQQPFGTVVRDLLIQQGITTSMGNPNWAEFALRLPTLHYETLRKAVTGERPPAAKIMEEVAQALDVEPSLFYEYELLEVQKRFDPREVGADQAFSNLLAWKSTRVEVGKPKRQAPQLAQGRRVTS